MRKGGQRLSPSALQGRGDGGDPGPGAGLVDLPRRGPPDADAGAHPAAAPDRQAAGEHHEARHLQDARIGPRRLAERARGPAEAGGRIRFPLAGVDRGRADAVVAQLHDHHARAIDDRDRDLLAPLGAGGEGGIRSSFSLPATRSGRPLKGATASSTLTLGWLRHLLTIL